MSWFELQQLSEYLYDKDKMKLEQLRIIKHAILQPHCNKQLELTDVMKFSWDGEEDGDDFQLII